MFDNFINRHDISRVMWGLRHGYFKKILSRLAKNKAGRVRQQWSEKKQRISSWWMIPEIMQHTNRLISGDEKEDYYHYVSKKYFSQKEGVIGLSLGCGKGHRELIWAKLIDFQKIDAFDLSSFQIQTARENATKQGLENIINYHVADILHYDFKENYFDVVFVEQSLHHFSPLSGILDQVIKAMKPGGLFVVNEFIGPDRFQWTDRQLEVANAMRRLIPSKYRRHIVDESTNKTINRPSRLSMLMKDPSEAIESSCILPLLKEKFEIIDYKPYDATISHILFDGIAHNFVNEEEARPIVKHCLEIEHYLIESGDLNTDYALIICRKTG